MLSENLDEALRLTKEDNKTKKSKIKFRKLQNYEVQK